MPGAMPQDHARTLREQGPVSRRMMILGALGTIASVVVLIIALSLTGDQRVPPGCFSTYLPGPIGAIPARECGAEARATCRHLLPGPQLTAKDVQLLADACRQAHLPLAPAA